MEETTDVNYENIARLKALIDENIEKTENEKTRGSMEYFSGCLSLVSHGKSTIDVPITSKNSLVIVHLERVMANIIRYSYDYAELFSYYDRLIIFETYTDEMYDTD